MYRYKRGISDKEVIKKSSFFITNNKDVMSSLSYDFGAYRIYDGLYIKKNKILIENMIEEIEFKNNVYKMANIATSTASISNDEYIKSIDLNNNEIKYDIDNVTYTKRIIFDENSDTLILNYRVENKENFNIKFRTSPLITYRDLYHGKTSQYLRFTQRNIKNGVVINLSVHDNVNLYIASDKCSYYKDVEYINNVRHFVINQKLEKKVFSEDLVIPGMFETVVHKNTVEDINILISTKEIDIKYNEIDQIEKKYFEKREEKVSAIPEEYVELKDLAKGISSFDLFETNISSFPYTMDLEYIYNKEETTLEELLNYVEVVTDYTKSIEGRFVILNRENDALEAIGYVENIIEDIENLNIKNEKFLMQFSKLKLWYIEILYKVINEKITILSPERVSFVKSMICEMIREENKKYILQNIETAALLFNGVKICRHILNKNGMDEVGLYEEEIYIKTLIENEFFVHEKNCMKENLNSDIVKPNISMIYTLSLSYPCVVGEISIKLLDTIFKELYTPYGIRTVSKKDINCDGMIYPKYLAHFIKANLRQNGITRASKKIAYNLVKEIIMDINKKVNGGVPKVYNERGIIVDNISYDLLTNAELIRLYDMLT